MARRPQSESDRWLLQQHVRIAQALAEMFHPLVESVVHDYRATRPGIKAIFGGRISGRKVGDSLTDIGRQRVRGRPIPDDLVGYGAESAGGKRLKSASLAIRNPAGELIGALCLNMDLSLLNEVQQLVNVLTALPQTGALPRVERFRSRAPREEVAAAVFSEIRLRGLVVTQLTHADKRQVVRSLAEKGLLSRRGAVTTIAQALGITRPTVYRYVAGE